MEVSYWQETTARIALVTFARKCVADLTFPVTFLATTVFSAARTSRYSAVTAKSGLRMSGVDIALF